MEKKTYKVRITERAAKQLHKLNRQTFLIITNWMKKNLEGCSDPRAHGKALNGTLVGQWRYRVGDYRILARISDDEIIIYVLGVGHRREIYD